MSKTNQVVAIACSDIHLSHKPPIARSAEPDWYSAMARPLKELERLAKKHNVPILCAGDVFDKWNSSAELINFALNNLPSMRAIPGQHDLPFHDYGSIRKTAFWTLVTSKVIDNLQPDTFRITDGRVDVWGDIILKGFPWGEPLTPCVGEDRGGMGTGALIAIVHAYCWAWNCKHPKAEHSDNAKSHRKSLAGYDVLIFGDNHKGFVVPKKEHKPCVFNCGTLMRRKMDEIDYEPMVGLVYSDGRVEPHKLDCSKDKFIDATQLARRLELEGEEFDAEDFLNELTSLADSALNFVQSVKDFLRANKVNRSTSKIILEAIEGL